MAIDETITRPKSMIASTSNSNTTQYDKTPKNASAPTRMGHLLARKQRIERWAYKGRSSSRGNTVTLTSAALSTPSAQKSSERSFSLSNRKLDIQLMQLSEQRQKTIEQKDFDQKLFANKQALRHKDDPNILKTLTYVRKCCKYADTSNKEEDDIDPERFLEENKATKRSQSRSPSSTSTPVKRNLSAISRTQTSASLAETFLEHNKKHIGSYRSTPISRQQTESKTPCETPMAMGVSETPIDDDAQKRHVQFRINTDGTHLITSQSAHAISKSRPYSVDKQTTRHVVSVNDIRSSNASCGTRVSNSAPQMLTVPSVINNTNEPTKQSSQHKRRLSRINSGKDCLQEFRHHPERFLSASNRYLPLLRRQATDIDSKSLHDKQQKEKIDSMRKQRVIGSPSTSRLSDRSDLTYDDAKSFLSEENDIGKSTPHEQLPVWLEQDRKKNKRSRISSKLDMSETFIEDTSEYRMAMARLRDHEYAHLNELIRSNPIEQILEPFSAIKTDDNDQADLEQQKSSNYSQQSPTSTKNEHLPIKTTKIRQLGDILHSIDSLHCSDTVDKRARRQVDLEKNRAKLGILIF